MFVLVQECQTQTQGAARIENLDRVTGKYQLLKIEKKKSFLADLTVSVFIWVEISFATALNIEQATHLHTD